MGQNMDSGKHQFLLILSSGKQQRVSKQIFPKTQNTKVVQKFTEPKISHKIL